MFESQKYYYKLRVLSSQMNTRIMDLISMLKPSLLNRMIFWCSSCVSVAYHSWMLLVTTKSSETNSMLFVG